MAKFCMNCGSELRENQKFCEYCGRDLSDTTKSKNDFHYNDNNNENVNNNVNKTANNVYPLSRSRVAAGILGILLGGLGIHNFYLGFYGRGLTQMLLSILSCGLFTFVTYIWGFVEGVLILAGAINKDADGNPLI